MNTLKVGSSCVYDEKISITLLGFLSKFVWQGHVFFLAAHETKTFIPANNKGWKWHLDPRDIGINSSTLKLTHSDESASYLAIHFNNLDPAPHPLTFSLNMPEFLGNFATVIVSDEYERERSLIHDVSKPLEIGRYSIEFTEISAKRAIIDIHNPD